MKGKNDYPPDWAKIALEVKSAAGWRCIRCQAPSDRTTGHVLTVHHLDLDKSNCRWYNLLALCQRCHLTIQATVDLRRPWPFTHSLWFQPYVAGWYAFFYQQRDLTRPQVLAELPSLLALEAQSLFGRDPLAVERAR